jgi:uncharacterized protein (DUF2062 family)
MILSKRFKRKLKIYYSKLVRSKGSIHSIAMGIAIGIFMSVAIPLGQMLIAIPMAFLFKAHRGMAVLFTFISNPYTTPMLYPAACLIGAKVLGISLSFVQIQSSISEIFSSFRFHELSEIGWDLLISFMVGGPILGIVMAVPGYFISTRIISAYRKRRECHKMLRHFTGKE